MFTAKKPLISDIIVDIANDALPENKKKALRNCLSVIVISITNVPKIAVHMLDSENEKISKRGCKKDSYLFGKERTLEDVISYYYENSFCNSEGTLELKKDLLLTELCLMFGVFEGLYEKYNREARIENQRLLRARAQAAKGESTESIDELRRSFENMLALKKHLEVVCTSIRVERIATMGLHSEGSNISVTDLEECVNLASTYRDTMNSFSLAKKQLATFCQEEDAYAANGLELLKSCGDGIVKLPHPVNKAGIKEKVKR